MRKLVYALSNFNSSLHKMTWGQRVQHSVSLAAYAVGMIAAAPASALDITTEDNAPFNYVDGGQRITGISTDILTEMARRAGVPIKIQVLPWARAYQHALNTAETCVYSTVKLPEREAAFKWVGPLATNKWVLFGKSDFNKPINSIEDARNYRIGGVTLDAKALYLKSLGFSNFDLVGDDNLNLVKLTTGRIDLWISGLYKGRELAAEVGVKNIKPVFVVRDVDYFLACNPKTSEATLSALTQALATLHKEGFAKAVADRYADRLQP
jgi:polar amino acid transport system substrate-binding protein